MQRPRVASEPLWIIEDQCGGSEVWAWVASSCAVLTYLSFCCRSPSPSTWGLPVASCKGEKLPSEGGGHVVHMKVFFTS